MRRPCNTAEVVALENMGLIRRSLGHCGSCPERNYCSSLRSLNTVLPDFLSCHVISPVTYSFYGVIHHNETLSRGPSLELEPCCLDLQIPKLLAK